MMIMQINPTVLTFQESVKIDFRDISKSIEDLFDPYEVEGLVRTDLNPISENATTLTEHDVICGRSKLAHAHPGNKKFRSLIRKYSGAYQSTRLREEKKKITMAIINTTIKLGGRFLRFDEKANLFFEVNSEYRYEKVSHSLRSAKTKRCRSQNWTSDDLEPLKLTEVDNQIVRMDSPILEGFVENGQSKSYPSCQIKKPVAIAESNVHDFEPIKDFDQVDMQLDEKIVDLLRQL